jgi:hypothetical protein
MEAGPRNRAQQPDSDAETAPLTDDGPDTRDGLSGAAGDPLTDPRTLDDPEGFDDGDEGPGEGGESFRELRPPRRLRLWQLAPVVGLAALGSLMFAFPLAFEPGGGTGAVVSMLGLLICGCAAGWGVLATRRVGLSWPGLPAPDSGERPDWRIVALYAVVVGTLVVLAIWRVARLR